LKVIESLNCVGLKPAVKVDLFNGALKCKFNNYQLFKGKQR
jgi:putative N6-adenine-specific DNA methylase